MHSNQSTSHRPAAVPPRPALGGRHLRAVASRVGAFFFWAAPLAAFLLFALYVGGMLGCDLKERQSTLEQRQRESIAEKTTTSVVQDSVIVPSPTVIETESKGGEKTRIEVPAVSHTHTATNTTATAASDSAASGASVQSVKFPAWVAMIGGVVALVILTGLIWFWRRSSLAVKAATDKLDAGLAAAIHKVRSEAINAAPADTARLVTVAADLERDRVNAIKRA